MDYSIVIMGHLGCKFPHAIDICNSNPNRHVETHNSDQELFIDKQETWRNCDRNIRDWAQSVDSLDHSHYLFLEYDVYANGYNFDKLVTDHYEPYDLVSPYKSDRYSNHFSVKEIPNLPVAYRKYATIVHPLAILLLSKRLLTEMIHEDHDELFELDIFCELRMGTFAAAHAMELGIFQANQLTRVNTKNHSRKEGYICHPVKK